MKALQRKKKIVFALSLILTIGFPLGILGIIFGAEKDVVFLLVLGIIFTVLGFYGMPFAWLSYAGLKKYVILNYAVSQDGLRKISDIALQTGCDEKTALNNVNTAISKRYLLGYRLSADKTFLEKIWNDDGDRERTIPISCASCGAKTMVKETDMRCPYCGTVNERG